SWVSARQIVYAYYDGTLAHGNANDLLTATLEDGSGSTLDTEYFRYYTGESGGYKEGMKYRFSATDYGRLLAAQGSFTNIENASDATVAPYASSYFQYDTTQRVTREDVAGAGTSLG